MTVRINIETRGTSELEAKFDRARDTVKDHAKKGTKQVAEKGEELAKDFAPKDTGQLEEFIDHRWWGGLRARVYVRRGGILLNDNRPEGPTGRGKHYGHGYGYWQEMGAYDYRNPFMEPAAAALNDGIAETWMSFEMFTALAEAGLEVGY